MKIENKTYYNEIVADDGNYLYRKADEKPNYFTKGSMLDGETESDFIEIKKEDAVIEEEPNFEE